MSELETVTVVARTIVYVERLCGFTPEAIGAAIQEAMPTLYPEALRQGLTPVDMPLTLYRPKDGKAMAVQPALPVRPGDELRAKAPLHGGLSPAGQAWRTVHKGSYDRLHETYDAVMPTLMRHGFHPMTGLCWEIYRNDPGNTPESELITEIYFMTAAP